MQRVLGFANEANVNSVVYRINHASTGHQYA